MANKVREVRVDSRSARQKLAARAEPYWRTISEGAHLGYYRGSRVGKWKARYRPVGEGGTYRETTLGEADDLRDADGNRVLTFAQAQAAARVWFDACSGVSATGPYTVSDALDDYMKGFRGKSVMPTRNRIESLIRPALGSIQVSKLKTAQIVAWHRERAAAPAMLRTAKTADIRNVRPADDDEAIRKRRSTANRDLTVLKAALNAAFREGRAGSDVVWRKVKPFPNVDGVKLRYLSDDETRRFVSAVDPEFRPMVVAALLTGARYGDLCGAKCSDLDLAASTLFLPNGKGGRRHVYLDKEGAEHMRQASVGKLPHALLFHKADGRAWRASEQQRPMEAASIAAQVEKVNFHDLRRTYGARLALQGVPMAVIAEAMGHKDERITRRHYAHLAPSYVAEQIRRYAGGLGIVPERDH